MPEDLDGLILCAWCGKELGWAGPETVYSVCKGCVPLAHEALFNRPAATEEPPPRARRAGGRRRGE